MIKTSTKPSEGAGPGRVDQEPWRGLSEQVAATIEPELDAVAAETLAAIAREVPEYARPFEGSFGRGIRTGVEEALRQFVALIRDPEGGRGFGREVYVELGRGESRQGRTLDSLQAAYRVGARAAWRRMSAAARGADLPPEELSLLAEAIFAYIDELSADSVEGYAEAQAEVEDRRRRLRQELVAMLVREPPPPEADLRAAAAEAGWTPGSGSRRCRIRCFGPRVLSRTVALPYRLFVSVEMVGFAEHEKSAPSRFANVC